MSVPRRCRVLERDVFDFSRGVSWNRPVCGSRSTTDVSPAAASCSVSLSRRSTAPHQNGHRDHFLYFVLLILPLQRPFLPGRHGLDRLGFAPIFLAYAHALEIRLCPRPHRLSTRWPISATRCCPWSRRYRTCPLNLIPIGALFFLICFSICYLNRLVRSELKA